VGHKSVLSKILNISRCVLLIQLQRVKHKQFLQAHDYFQYGELVAMTACGLDPLGCPQKADSLKQDILTAIPISVEGCRLKVELVLI